jgi:hypothetical protein
MVTSDNWRQRMCADMRLRDFRPRTQEGYSLAVKLFLRWVDCEPEAVDAAVQPAPRNTSRSSAPPRQRRAYRPSQQARIAPNASRHAARPLLSSSKPQARRLG